jgi:hypothetical protein
VFVLDAEGFVLPLEPFCPGCPGFGSVPVALFQKNHFLAKIHQALHVAWADQSYILEVSKKSRDTMDAMDGYSRLYLYECRVNMCGDTLDRPWTCSGQCVILKS